MNLSITTRAVSLNQFSEYYDLGPITKLKWEDYRRDCGYYAFLASPAKSQEKFERTYYN